jgi:hypothetical protein
MLFDDWKTGKKLDLYEYPVKPPSQKRFHYAQYSSSLDEVETSDAPETLNGPGPFRVTTTGNQNTLLTNQRASRTL